MKTKLISMVVAAALVCAAAFQAKGKGACAHGHVGYAGHSHPFYAMSRLRDSSFAGFAVMDNRKKDTIRGSFNRFTSTDLRWNPEDGSKAKRIGYRNIQLLHLLASDGQVVFTTLPARSGYYRLLVDDGSLALYDQRLIPHHSLADIDTTGLVFRYGTFSRMLRSDFSPALRKRLVPIINAHYDAGIVRSTPCAEVYRVMAERK